jgi:hypothetical protein
LILNSLAYAETATGLLSSIASKKNHTGCQSYNYISLKQSEVKEVVFIYGISDKLIETAKTLIGKPVALQYEPEPSFFNLCKPDYMIQMIRFSN